MNLKQELVLLLSNPSISDKEFRGVSIWLKKGGIEMCLKDAEGVRATLLSYQASSAKASLRQTRPIHDGLVSDLTRLLREQAGMIARGALGEIKQRTGFSGDLPDKISFSAGLERIRKEIGASALLTVANQIRNDRVHQTSNSAWSLNRD